MILRVFLRPHREPATRITWTAVIIALPILGLIGYVLLGEVNIGRRRIARMRQVLSRMPDPAALARPARRYAEPHIPAHLQHLFRAGQSVNGFDPVGGNAGRLLADSNATIDAIVADIDAARAHVHLSFYIWLADRNGLKVIAALKRATARGIVCRAIADDLGSRALIGSPHWREMQAAGVQLVRALPIGNPAAAGAEGAGRPAEPPQDRRGRQLDRLLRQPELRGSGIPGEGEVRALGRRGHAVRGPGRAPAPVPVRQRLDGPFRRGSAGHPVPAPA